MDRSWLAVAIAIITLIFSHFGKKTKKKKIIHNIRKEAPEPIGGWAIFGHIPLLSGESPAHEIMGAMADRHGPAMTLRLGRQRLLLISNWELAKECFTTNDRAFSSRPQNGAAKHISFNFAGFALAPFGPNWSETRQIMVHELLSGAKLESLQHLWVSEVGTCVKDMYRLWVNNSHCQVTVNMTEMFWDLSVNVITRLVAGKRIVGDDAREYKRVAGQLLHLLTYPNVGDYLPYLRWLDLQGHERVCMKTAREMESIIQRWMEEHYRRLDVDAELDFLDVLMSKRKEGNLPPHHPPDTFIKANILMLIASGSETTSTQLTWALSLLINNRHVLEKAKVELDMQVGPNRMVERSDIRKLTYIQAIVKETLRLYPVSPLLVPHEAIEDCHVGGFHVRTGTHLLVNVWKIHRDPRVWFDPLRFRPERFLERHVDVDVWGQHFELLPFGSGRRSCVGSSLAVEVIQLALAHLLHSFDWATPYNAHVDMTEDRFAFSLVKVRPLELLVTPRLHLGLYE